MLRSLAVFVGLLPFAAATAQTSGTTTPASGAQTPAPPACSTPEYRQFDFWVGDWEVKGPKGAVVGHNKIDAILDGCALREQWTSAGKNRGTSVNFYDASSGTWHQTWIDNSGQPLHLVGRFRDGSMVMEQTVTGADGKTTRHRITWTPLDGGDVRQHWESSTDGGTTWSTLFDGRYHRMRPS